MYWTSKPGKALEWTTFGYNYASQQASWICMVVWLPSILRDILLPIGNLNRYRWLLGALNNRLVPHMCMLFHETFLWANRLALFDRTRNIYTDEYGVDRMRRVCIGTWNNGNIVTNTSPQSITGNINGLW